MPIVSADKFTYFEPKAGISNVQNQMVVPGTPALPSEAQTAGARMILNVGDELEKMGKVIREAQVKDDVQRFTLGAMEELSKAEQEVSREGSHRDMPDRFRTRLDEIQKSYADQIGQDPAVKSAFNEKFGLLALHHTDRIRTLSWRRELDQQQAGAIEASGTALNLIGQARTMKEVETHVDDYLGNLEYKALNGLVDASWAAQQGEIFKGRVGSMLVEQDIFVDPAGAMQKLTEKDLSKIYPGLTEEKRVDYLRIARAQFEHIQNENVQAQDRQARAIEKEKKDLQEKNYGDALVAFSQGKLTETGIQDLLARREIDPDKGATLISKIRDEGRRERKEENDPVVVGDLASRMELGADISNDLARAYRNGQMKTETFIGLKRQAADALFKRGLSYINNALKPSEADKWTPDKHIRHAEAVDEYTSRVASGQDSLDVSRDIVGRYMGDVRRTVRGIPRPRFLDGDKMDVGALEQAQQKTAEAFKTGRIDSTEFSREAERLKLLSDLALKARADSEDLSSEELKEREKAVKKKGKK